MYRKRKKYEAGEISDRREEREIAEWFARREDRQREKRLKKERLATHRKALKEDKDRAVRRQQQRRWEQKLAREIWEERHPIEVRARLRERERQTRRRKKGRALVAKIKEGPCADCGKTYHPEAMEFDHVRGAKKNNISKLVNSKLATLEAEIAKCDLVCANCHRIRTAGRRVDGRAIL